MDQGGGSRTAVGPGAFAGLSVLLALTAFRELLRTPASPPLQAFEHWLFEPSHVVPVVVLLGAAWLLWCRRGALAGAREIASPSPVLAGLCFAGAAAVHAWATLTGADFLLVPSLMLVLAGFGALVAGLAGCRALALPIGFLVFAIPVPAPLLNWLVWEQQEALARITADVLNWFAVPATAGGIFFERPGKLFVVIEACTGVRMAEVFAAFGVLCRGLERPDASRSGLMACLGVLVGLFVNQLRVLWIAVGSGPLASGDEHASQGIAALALGLPLVYLLHRLVREPRRPGPREPARLLAEPGPWPPLVGLLALLAGTSFALESAPLPRATAYDFVGIPAARAGWESKPIATDYLILGSVRFEQVFNRGFSSDDGDVVALFLGASLTGDPEISPFSRSTDIPMSGWIVLERFPVTLGERPAEGLVLATRGYRALAFTWRTGDLGLVWETLRAALALDRNPFAEPRRRAVVRILTELFEPGPEDRARAAAVLEDFAEAFSDALPDA